jgi:GNAT superfamily N-acetyltransferase
MKSEVKVRPAVAGDLEALLHHNLAMALETEDLQLDEPTVRLGVGNLLAAPHRGFYLMAEVGGAVAGSLMVTSEWSDWRNCELWWFQSVYVRPAFRGAGVFSALFREVERLAALQGVKELRLYVERENLAAQAVYGKLGMGLSHYDMWEVRVGK